MAAATNADALRLLRRNAAASADRVMFERLLLHTLVPGGAELAGQLSSVRRVFGQGMDYVFVASPAWSDDGDVQTTLSACADLVGTGGGQVWLLEGAGRAGERAWPAPWQALAPPADGRWPQNLTILSLRGVEAGQG